MPSEYVICQVTKKRVLLSDAKPLALIRPGVLDLIKKQHPNLPKHGYVSSNALKKFRQEYIESILSKEQGDLSKLDKEVVKSLVHNETISKNINTQFDKKLTFGERVSDKMASFGGSWKFIIMFGCIMFLWITTNVYILVQRPFDPYPFILLNLCLSCLAALQAPVIMMSQNRKDARDRLRAENDYKVNLKAELEIRVLHEKLDNLMQHQWQRLLEIQQLQIDMMEEKSKDSSKKSK